MFGEDFTQLNRKESQQKYEENDAEPIQHPWNFFEQSDFALSRSLPLQTFGSIHSFSVR